MWMEKSNEALKEKINKLAIEWSELEHRIRNGDNSEQLRIKMETIWENIWCKMHELFAGNQKIRHWVSDNKFTEDVVYVGESEVLYGDFIDIIADSLDVSKKGHYDIDKSDNYIAYIYFLAGRRKNKNKGGNISIVSMDSGDDGSANLNVNKMTKSDMLLDSEITEQGDLNAINIIIDLVINYISDYEKYDSAKRKELGKTEIKELVGTESIYTYFIIKYVELIKSSSYKRTVINGKKVPEASWNMTEEDYEICCKYDVNFEYLKKRDYHIYKFLKLLFVSMLKESEPDELKDLKEIIKRKLREDVDLNKNTENITKYMSNDEELIGQKVSRQWVSGKYQKFLKLLNNLRLTK